MSPQASQRQMVTTPSLYLSNVETKTNPIQSHHRRPQKICTTQRLPALFAWLLLLTTSFAYWICIFPEILILLPKLLPIPILHCVLFVLVCANFILATFMDPVNYFFIKKTQQILFSSLGYLRAIIEKRIHQCEFLYSFKQTERRY